MASHCHSPAMAFSPWGKMPLATVEIPTDAHRDLGGSECASGESFRAPVYGSNRSEGSSEACAEKTSIRSAKS